MCVNMCICKYVSYLFITIGRGQGRKNLFSTSITLLQAHSLYLLPKTVLRAREMDQWLRVLVRI